MRNARVLVVEDSPELLYALSRIIRSAGGYDVLEASSGAECLRIAAEDAPDLILLDVVWADISGIEV